MARQVIIAHDSNLTADNHGFSGQADPGRDTDIGVPDAFDEQRKLTKVTIYTDGSVAGDYIKFTVFDSDNPENKFDLFRNWFVFPGLVNELPISQDEIVPKGWKAQITYTSIGENPVTVFVNLSIFKLKKA